MLPKPGMFRDARADAILPRSSELVLSDIAVRQPLQALRAQDGTIGPRAAVDIGEIRRAVADMPCERAAAHARRERTAADMRREAASRGRRVEGSSSAASEVRRSAATEVRRSAATDVGRSTNARRRGNCGACRHAQCAGHQKHDSQFSSQIPHDPSSTDSVCAGDLSTAMPEFVAPAFFSAAVIEHECFAMLRGTIQTHVQTARRNINAFMNINAA
jgi:hypothetical protein